MKRLITAVALSLLTTTAIAEELPSWLCLTEKSTGFKLEDGSWHYTKFNAEARRYLIRPAKESEKNLPGVMKNATHAVFIFGKADPRQLCRYAKGAPLLCDQFHGEFKFNADTLRFMTTHTAGWVDGDDADRHTPIIEIGRCSEI
ncbi:hypothetical protein [Microbulbifer sp. MCCC 1A16149]|uniref:hypothetical protein n=1 Tax=Microbulbifer sp. MCCC 1A16149 TaxID=3411322 RepID=UPI003D10BDB7